MPGPRVWHDGSRWHGTIDIVPYSARAGPPVWPRKDVERNFWPRKDVERNF